MIWSSMMATRGVKSNMPVLGIMRRSGARIGSVILSRTKVSVFDLGENQDSIARMNIMMVSTSHNSFIKLNMKVILSASQLSGFIIGGDDRLQDEVVETAFFETSDGFGGGAAW